MRYSIFGFNQEKVCNLSAIVHNNGKDVIVRLDTTDMLILNHIADFPNRSKIVKRIIDEKVFFWISYDEILNELPILGIKKQALADRFKKYVILHIAKQELISLDSKHQNATFFCLTDVYESLLYEKEGYGSQLQEGIVVNYDTPSRSQLQDVYNNISNNNITSNNKEKEIDKSISTKKEKDELFERCWIAYNRKGSKKQAKVQWDKLDDVEKNNVLPHIKAYVGSREKQYQKDFERYLKDKVFLSIVFKGNQTIYDPTKLGKGDSTNNVYTPSGNFSLMWDEPSNAYMYIGYYYDGMEVADGYTNDNRPNGAKIILNNARGTIIWNSLTKKWERK